MCTSDLSQERIERALATRSMGRPTYYWPRVGSTMDEAHRLAKGGAPQGTMVIADEQTTGRGRLERTWWAPPGSSLLFTLLLRPDLQPRHAQRLTMICSLAICDAIAQVSGVGASVKWPNDLLIEGKKVCGILTELELVGDALSYALVGIGINVNVDLGDAPPLISPATSLQMETGREVSRLDLLVALLSGIEERYAALQAGHSFREEWAARMATIGQAVQATDGGEQWRGVAIAVDGDGALLVQLANGAVQRLLVGDVTLREH